MLQSIVLINNNNKKTTVTIPSGENDDKTAQMKGT